MSDSESSDDEGCCTECPVDLEYAKKKFQAPYMLSQAGIPCLILGSDALVLVFWIPRYDTLLHIVVADKFMDQAFYLITQNLGFKIAGPRRLFGTNTMLEQTSKYLNSRLLESICDGGSANPSHILIHPETAFNVTVGDYTRSTSVDALLSASFDQNVRLPTRCAMVDLIIDTLLHPEVDTVVTKRGRSELSLWLVDIVFRTSLGPLSAGELSPEGQTLLDCVKAENQQYFGAWLRNDGGRGDVEKYRESRRLFINQTYGKINLQSLSTCVPSIPCNEWRGQAGYPVSYMGPPLLH